MPWIVIGALIDDAAGLAGGSGAQKDTKVVAFNIKAIGKYGYITVDKFQAAFI